MSGAKVAGSFELIAAAKENGPAGLPLTGPFFWGGSPGYAIIEGKR